MVSPQVPQPNQTRSYIVLIVKILLVIVIILLLPKLVMTRSPAAHRRRKRFDKRFRTLRRECETDASKCGSFLPEEGMSCVSRCVSTSCHDEIYGADPLEDGEVDFHREKKFEGCVKREIRAERKAMLAPAAEPS